MKNNWTPLNADSVEKALCDRKSFMALHDTLHGIELQDLQCVDVMKMLYLKRTIDIYDTGTGKTLLAAAAMKLLWNEDPSRKFIMFVKKDQLAQTPKKIEDACGKRVIATAADAKSLHSILSVNYTAYSVLMLTHDCLANSKILQEIYEVKDQYCGVIVDEAHELNNFNHADSAAILASVVKNFEYCWALTATPIISDLVQLAKLAWIVNPTRYPNYAKLAKDLAAGRFRVSDDPCFFINRSRSELGSVCKCHGLIEWVDPLPHQKMHYGGVELLQKCKGEGAFPQAEKLVQLILQRQGQRGLVYISQHEIREWVLPFLNKAGIKYDCINGKTKFGDRVRIMSAFNEDKSLDVVITSVTTAVDLDCDYVIFYEFTLEVKQMIGRAHRGLGDKELDVIFMLTDDTDEVDYFANNILERSMMIRDLLNKDYSEMEDAERSLKEKYVIN